MSALLLHYGLNPDIALSPKSANMRLMHRALLGLFYHIVGAGKKGGRNVDAKARAVAELITKLNSVGCSMGRSLG